MFYYYSSDAGAPGAFYYVEQGGKAGEAEIGPDIGRHLVHGHLTYSDSLPRPVLKVCIF